MQRSMITGLAGLLLGAGAMGQTFNVEFGAPGSAPPATYGAAGLPGVWNTYETMPLGQRFLLVDIHGQSNIAMIYNIGGTGTIAADDPATSGADEALLDDAMTSLNNPLDTCIFFENLINGDYEILMYAVTPNQPGAQNRVSVDFSPTGPTWIGGPWTGQHVLGVTYQRFTVTTTNGRLGMHSGLPSGNVLSSLNGLQIRRIIDCPGDATSDYRVDFGDLNEVLSQYGQTGAGLSGDLNDDDTVDFADLNEVLGSYGGLCS